MKRLSLARVFALLLVLFLTGCAVFESDGPGATPTSLPNGQTEPTPSANLQDAPGTTYPVAWVHADLPPLPETPQEIASPFAAEVDAGDAVWRLYVVDGEGQPRLLLESERWLQTPIWPDADGPLTVPYSTQVLDPDDISETGYAFGHMQVELASGAVNWDRYSSYPDAIPDSWRLSPDGERYLLLDRTGPFGPQFPTLAGVVYVHGVAAGTTKLEGFTAESRAWSPDGRFFIASGYVAPDPNPQEPTNAYYLLEPGRNQAVLIGHAAPGRGLGAAWSADGTRLAFAEGTDLIIFNATTRSRVVIPLGVTLRGFPRWSADGRHVAVAGGVVDVAGQRVILPPLSKSPISTEVSPNGSTLAVTSNDIYGPDASCPSAPGALANQTTLRDLATGGERVVLDCASGMHSEATWLGNEHLVLRAPTCWACDAAEVWIKLLDVADNSLQDLTDGFENRGSYAVSPDGSRVLVGGSRLRVYAANGEVLRRIDVSPDRRVTGLVWSPDGSSFAYIVGPRLDLL